jgi:tRNA (guanine-N1)-methyltransferase
MMKIDILTLFPEMFTGPFSASILKRAQDSGLIGINLVNIRDYSTNKHSARLKMSAKSMLERPAGWF